MISKPDILKIAKQFVSHQQGRRPRRIIHPRREWAIGIVVFTFAVLGASGFGWWQYDRNQPANIEITTTGTDARVTYDTDAATQLIQTFAERRLRYNLLQSASTETTDTAPSTLNDIEPTEDSSSSNESGDATAASPATESATTEASPAPSTDATGPAPTEGVAEEGSEERRPDSEMGSDDS